MSPDTYVDRAGRLIARSGRSNPVARFWRFVHKADGDACWLWTASFDRKGYGQFVDEKRRHWVASRYSWLVTHGDPGKLHVCHHCDNPACCRPDHLFLGTNVDNQRDVATKNRRKGDRSHLHKLIEQDIPRIRAMAAAGVTQARIARQFGVGQSAISCAVNGVTWGIVP